MSAWPSSFCNGDPFSQMWGQAGKTESECKEGLLVLMGCQRDERCGAVIILVIKMDFFPAHM